MGKVVAICNFKGGVGKTATSFNLAAACWICGKKVLVVDCDNQSELTKRMNIHPNPANSEDMDIETLYGWLLHYKSFEVDQVPIYERYDRFHFIPSQPALTNLEIVLSEKARRTSTVSCENYYVCLKRCLDTIGAVAKLFHMPIKEDERLRERTKGANSSIEGMREKRWADHSFHEEGGESIEMVQSRNVEALKEILTKHEGKNIIIGTHGTALSSIINFYKPEFGCEDYIRIVNWMPYIVEMDFEGQDFVGMNEITHAE